jgi:phosphoribosyl 1,2-cyclic phosphodiesterase
MRLTLLASGSNGNALLVERGSLRLLIDAGLGPRRLQHRLEPLGLTAADITHCLLTHAHDDHAAGLPALIKRQPELEVLATRAAGRLLPPEARRRVRPLVAGRSIALGGLAITPVAAAHDGAGAVSLRLDSSEGAVGLAIDLGSYGAPTLDLLRGCRVLVVESNHCPRLLAHGPYPGYLKRRVAGPLGHLSNGQCRALLEEVVHDGLERVLLAHLSAVNNRPEAIWAELDELRRAFPAGTFQLGSREEALPPIILDELEPGARSRGGRRGQLALPF